MFKQFDETFTFDDVLLVPQKSSILPKDALLKTKLTKDISLNIPFVSAPMDTVTEHKTAIAMALSGGIGIIHKNLSLEEQVKEVKLVKRFKNGFIENPIIVNLGDSLDKIIEIRKKYGYKKVPVVDKNGKLVGLIGDTDYLMPFDKGALVKNKMEKLDKLIVAKVGISLDKANQMIRDNKLRILLLVDGVGKLVNIVTRKDLEKNDDYPSSTKNTKKQLRVGAAIGAGPVAVERAEELIKAGVDVLVIDTAHGHSKGVIDTLRVIKKKYKNQQIIVGNIATGEAAKELIEAGADAVKVGIGPGSICTTRIIAGIGVPQLSAIMEVSKAVKQTKKDIPVIADGGIKSSGDIVKALAAGASCVMMGNMFAGTDESPGRVQFMDGRMHKTYRGMGSIDAMDKGSKDRYGQGDVKEKQKYVPEGVSGKVPYKGSIDRIIYQMAGGLRSGMGYNGAETITELQKRAKFVKISAASVRENHPHDLGEIDNAPNYRVD